MSRSRSRDRDKKGEDRDRDEKGEDQEYRHPSESRGHIHLSKSLEAVIGKKQFEASEQKPVILNTEQNKDPGDDYFATPLTRHITKEEAEKLARDREYYKRMDRRIRNKKIREDSVNRGKSGKKGSSQSRRDLVSAGGKKRRTAKKTRKYRRR